MAEIIGGLWLSMTAGFKLSGFSHVNNFLKACRLDKNIYGSYPRRRRKE
jgi:hypothetical protein